MADLGNLFFGLHLKDMSDKELDDIVKKVQSRLENNKIKLGIDFDQKTIEDLISRISKMNNTIGGTGRKGNNTGGNTDLRKRLGDLASINRQMIRLQYEIDKLNLNNRQDPFQGEKIKEAIALLEKYKVALSEAMRGGHLESSLSMIRRGELTEAVNRARLLAREQRDINARRREEADVLKSLNAEQEKQHGLLSQLKGQIAEAYSIYAIERFTRSVIEIGGEFQKQRIALRAMLGEVSKADDMFSKIKELAIVSPFNFRELMGFTKQVAAFGIPYEEMYETTKRLADISAGLGVDMGRIVLAYGQVRSAAVLRGQELRQFTEAGIPLVDELADKFSKLEGRVVSAGEVFDKISRREVSFGMVRDILWDLTNEGGKFYRMQEVLTESLAGKFAKLKDSYEMMLSAIADSHDNFLGDTLDNVTALMEKYEVLLPVIKSLFIGYSSYKVVLALTNLAMVHNIASTHGLANAAVLAAKRLEGEVVAMSMMNAGTARMTIGFYKLRTAMMSLSVLSGLVGVMMLVGTAVYQVYQHVTKLKRELDDLFIKANDKCREAINDFETLTRKLSILNKGSKEYNDTVDMIQSKYGSYLDNLEKEAYSYETLTKQIDNVTEALRNKAYEEARQQGQTTIRDHFADDISKYTGKLEKSLKRFFDMPDGVAKAVALGFINKVKEYLSDERAFDSIELLNDVLEINGTKQRAKGSEKKGRGYMDRTAIWAFNLAETLREVNRQTEQFNNTLSAISVTSADKKIEDIAKMREKLRSMSEPIGRDAVNAFDMETLKLQLKAIEDMPDGEKQRGQIRRRMDELLNYGDTWVRMVESIRDSIIRSKGVGNELAKNLMPTSEQIEKGQMTEWLKDLADKYRDAKKYISDMSQIPQSLRNTEVQMGMKNSSNAIMFADMVSKAFGLDFNSFGNDSSSTKDSLLERIRERLSLVKDAYSEYRKWEGTLGREMAMVKIREGELFSVLGDDGVPTSLEDYKSKMESIRDDLRKAITRSSTKERRDALRETLKILLDVELDIKKESLEKELDRIKTDIDEMTGEWGVFENVLGKTGNISFSTALAFGDIEVGENGLLKDLRKRIEESLKGSDLDFSDVIGLDRTSMEKRGLKSVAPFVDAYKKGLRDLRKSTADSLTELIASYADYGSKIAIVEQKKNKDIEYYIKNRETLEKSGLDVDNLIYERKRKAEEEKSSILFEKFKNENDWAKIFDDLDRMSTATIESMIRKFEDFSKTQKLSIEDTKALMEALSKLRSEWAGRSPFKAMRESFNKILKARRALKSSSTGSEKLTANESLKEAQSELNKSIDKVIGKFDALAKTSQFLEGVFDSLGAGDGLGNLMSVLGGGLAGGAQSGMAATAIFGAAAGPWGAAAGAALGLISGLAGLHDKNLDKKIQKSQLQVRKLENAYSSLSDTIERQLGSASRSQTREMMSNLKAQRAELVNQMHLEDKKKKTDKGKMEDYRKQIEEISNEMRYFYEDLASDQYGASIKDWASSISDALTQAFENGTDAAEAFDDAVADIMRNVANNMIRLEVIEPAMANLREYLFGSKGIFTDNSDLGADLSVSESKGLAEQLAALKDKIGQSKDIWDSINSALKDQGLDMSSKDDKGSGLSQGIKGITENTADLLASYINAIRQDVSVKRGLLEKALGEDFPQIGALSQAQLSELKAIATNTKRNADLVQDIRDILHRNVTGGNRFNI